MAISSGLPPAPRWLRHLWLAPLVTGTAWLLTLTVLLSYWVACGQPRLPKQSNPWVPFISDIGAFALQPFFIFGCAIAALSFLLTVYAVHYARYSPYLHNINTDVTWRKVASGAAMLSGVVASGGLLLLAVFDTYEYHDTHQSVLLVCLIGLSGCIFCTTAVWFDQTWVKWWDMGKNGVRIWCLLSNVFMFIEICLTVIFISFLWSGHMKLAGILEWVMTYFGAFYLLTFIGYLRGAELIAEEGEEAPLLADSDSRSYGS